MNIWNLVRDFNKCWHKFRTYLQYGKFSITIVPRSFRTYGTVSIILHFCDISGKIIRVSVCQFEERKQHLRSPVKISNMSPCSTAFFSEAVQVPTDLKDHKPSSDILITLSGRAPGAVCRAPRRNAPPRLTVQSAVRHSCAAQKHCRGQRPNPVEPLQNTYWVD